jgi:hypothetical protein
MLAQLRGAFTGVAFLLLSGVTLFAAAQAFTIGLPSALPSHTSAMIAALASQDMSRDSKSDKVKLGDRVQRELSEEVDWPAELAALKEPQRQRLVENVTELAIASFDNKVERFYQRREQDRPKFVGKQIDEIVHWAVVLDRVSRTEGEPLIGPAALAGLMARIKQWYASATPDELARLQGFQKAVADELPKRLMRRMRPGEN